jgi:hypothetical protein
MFLRAELTNSTIILDAPRREIPAKLNLS